VVFIGSDGVGLWMRIMDCQIVEARYITGHTVWLRSRDGTTGSSGQWASWRLVLSNYSVK